MGDSQPTSSDIEVESRSKNTEDIQSVSESEFEQRLKTIEAASEHLEAKIDEQWTERKRQQEQLEEDDDWGGDEYEDEDIRLSRRAA